MAASEIQQSNYGDSGHNIGWHNAAATYQWHRAQSRPHSATTTIESAVLPTATSGTSSKPAMEAPSSPWAMCTVLLNVHAPAVHGEVRATSTHRSQPSPTAGIRRTDAAGTRTCWPTRTLAPTSPPTWAALRKTPCGRLDSTRAGRCESITTARTTSRRGNKTACEVVCQWVNFPFRLVLDGRAWITPVSAFQVPLMS